MRFQSLLQDGRNAAECLLAPLRHLAACRLKVTARRERVYGRMFDGEPLMVK
jgi:hypothetical protein